jgi:hypothetical protein
MLSKKIEELNDKNKQNCLSYYEQIKKEITENNKNYAAQYSLIEVFYSKKMEDCIYTTYYFSDFRWTHWGMKVYKYWVNVTNGKAFIAYDLIENFRNSDIFNDKIEELKK